MDDQYRIMQACSLADRVMSEGMDREQAHIAAEERATSRDIHGLGLEMSAHDE